MLALGAKFVAEARQFNETRAAIPSDEIEITHGEAGVQLRKNSLPYGFLSVRVGHNRDSADLECEVVGAASDGRTDTKTFRYSATWSPIGFVIRNAAGRAISEDAFVLDLMTPFSRHISG